MSHIVFVLVRCVAGEGGRLPTNHAVKSSTFNGSRSTSGRQLLGRVSR
ncbi:MULTISPECIES: hypothetical protein [unclassified Actinopolyspora]|nr:MULTISPECIES: hypothetical protein [unclassified Actinopolyspora]NHD16954.1 hypothetical protein [Actinopolyspora sp. BKK2]NHE76106.1 hypothetical protein [Actinopolyspora sp. BKK1]